MDFRCSGRRFLSWPYEAVCVAGKMVAAPAASLPLYKEVFAVYNGAPGLNRWPLIESALLLALVVVAWWPFTSAADLRTRAPA